MIVLCPKCRALGLDTDCAEQLGQRSHPQEGGAVNDPDAYYELEVQVRFATQVTSGLVLDPTEMASHMRERWLEDDTELRSTILAALEDDYDVQVRPVFFD